MGAELWAIPTLCPTALLLGRLLGVTRVNGGGLLPPLPCPCHLHPSMSGPSLPLHWSYWGGGELGTLASLPRGRAAARLSTASSAWMQDRYGGPVPFFRTPVPSQMIPGRAGPRCGLGHPAVARGALGTTASCSGATGSAGDRGLGPECGPAGVPHHSLVPPGCWDVLATLRRAGCDIPALLATSRLPGAAPGAGKTPAGPGSPWLQHVPAAVGPPAPGDPAALPEHCLAGEGTAGEG